MSESSPISTDVHSPPPRRRVPLYALAGAIVASGILFALLKGRDEGGPAERTTFAVQRGDLEIIVLEGGNVQALESQEIRSEVKGRQGVKILRIIEEGYMVTEEDIANGKVLVELDSAELIDRRINQRISVQNAEASYLEAMQNYEIQIGLNRSNVKLAELKAKFAHMDFEKYLGEESSKNILGDLGLDKKAVEVATLKIDESTLDTYFDLLALGDSESDYNDGNGAVPVEIPLDDRRQEAVDDDAEKLPTQATTETFDDGVVQMNLEYVEAPEAIDFSHYANPDLLEDGDAKQRARELEDKLIVAREEYDLAKRQYEGKQRLAERDFVTQSELEADAVKVNKSKIGVASAETALHLFRKYEFPKDAEQLLSHYEDALLELERHKKTAVLQLIKSSVALKTSQEKHRIESKKLADLEEQIEKTSIRAERPGLVVYGGNRNPWNNQQQIEEGTTVRQRQLILTIPDMTAMAVEVDVHESAINKIAIGQRARIRVDAYPHEALEGEIVKVAVLPDSRNRWMNPDLKVFKTNVQIDGVRAWLRPNMSAEVQIIIDNLDDVLYVPLHAVFAEEDERVCYVDHGGRAERRIVETGSFNEEFIEILDGLQEGEEIFMRAPEASALVQPETEDVDTELEQGPQLSEAAF